MMFMKNFQRGRVQPFNSILETTTGFVTAPGAAFGVAGSVAAVNQGTLTVRQFTMGRAWLVDTFRCGQAIGEMRIRSPKFHDLISGYRMAGPAAATTRTYCLGLMQQMFSQDVLILEETGTAVGGTIENVGYTTYYEQPTAGQANLINLDTLEARQQAYFQGPTVFALRFTQVGAVAGAYSAQTALNAGTLGALLKANTDYAIVGMTFDETAANNLTCVSLQGPGTGNYPVSIPAFQLDPQDSRNYFYDLTKYFGRPLVPVANAADAGGTFVSTLNTSVANTSVFTLIVVPLG